MVEKRQTDGARRVVGLILLIGAGGVLLPAGYALLGLGDTLLGAPLTLIAAAGGLYLVVGLALLWLIRARPVPPPVPPPASVQTVPQPPMPPVPPPAPRLRGDDLTQIEGVGLKCQSVLYQAGITTYSQLAATPVSTLERIVTVENRIVVLDGLIATWPDQAAYAAKGDLDGLEAYQARLRRPGGEA